MANKRLAKKAETKSKEEVKKTTEKASEKKETEKITEEKNTKDEKKTVDMPGIPKGYVPKPQEKLSYYTVVAMLSVLAAACATIVSFVFSANPLKSVVFSHITKLEDDDMNELIQNQIFDHPDTPKVTEQGDLIKVLAIACGIILAVVTLAIIVAVFIAIDKYKKPSILVDGIAVVLSVAATIVFVILLANGEDVMANSEFVNTTKDVLDYKTTFNIYYGALVCVIVNLVFSIANFVGGFIGLKKWKKNGQSY